MPEAYYKKHGVNLGERRFFILPAEPKLLPFGLAPPTDSRVKEGSGCRGTGLCDSKVADPQL